MLEVRASHSLVELLRLSAFDLVFEQPEEKLFVGEIVVHRFAHSELQRLQHATHS